MAKTLALGARPIAKGKHQRSGQRVNIRRYPPSGTEWGQKTWGAAAPPVITALTPSSLLASASLTTVTVTGTGFVAGSKVRLNTIERTTAFVNATTLTFTYDPGSATTLQIGVNNPDGQRSADFPLPVT